jgi:hypothetical protein
VAIQILRDILGEGGRQSVTQGFIHFEAMFLMLLEVKSFLWHNDKASKDIFYQRHSTFKANHDQKRKNVTKGEGAEKCHVLFECPLIQYDEQY